MTRINIIKEKGRNLETPAQRRAKALKILINPPPIGSPRFLPLKIRFWAQYI